MSPYILTLFNAVVDEIIMAPEWTKLLIQSPKISQPPLLNDYENVFS
jgi:hypothetical protein